MWTYTTEWARPSCAKAMDALSEAPRVVYLHASGHSTISPFFQPPLPLLIAAIKRSK